MIKPMMSIHAGNNHTNMTAPLPVCSHLTSPRCYNSKTFVATKITK